MIDGVTLQPGTALGSHPDGLSFEECYTLLQRLRSGSFGTVYTTQLLDTSLDKTVYACKVIDRTKLKPDSDDTVMRELAILRDIRDLDHVTQLKDCWVTPAKVYVVQTYCRGGDCFDQLSKLATYKESDARALATILLQVMELLHLRRLCHRDLKPENLLLVNRMQASQIVVADFGMAQYVPQDGFLKTRCGTPSFVAPEVIVGHPYNTQVDMWSIGTLLYMLLGGQPPFADPTFQGLFRKIQAADYDFSGPAWKNVSIPAKQCLASLLRTDPYYRATATQALQSSWIADTPESELSGNDLRCSIRELNSWVAKRRFRSAVHAVRLSSHFSRFVATDGESLWQKVKVWDAQSQGSGSSGGIEVAMDSGDGSDKFRNSLLSQLSVKGQKFDDLYEVQDLIAKGKDSTVYTCLRRKPKSATKLLAAADQPQNLAVKIIPRNGSAELEHGVLHEVAVMQNLKHPSLVSIVDFLEDDETFFLVLEYFPGKTLLEHLMSQQSFTEHDARSIMEQLLQAVAYFHGEGVVHRDISLENILMLEIDKSKKNNHKSDVGKFAIKICDFGLARKVPAPRSVTRCCGTPLYMSPEVCKHIPYDQSADMWSVGVLLYMLLVGMPPFAAQTEQDLFAKIRNGQWAFPAHVQISDGAKLMIQKLLVVEPLQRLTAEEALRSLWFQEDASSLSSFDLTDSIGKLKDLRSKFQTVAKVVMKLAPNSNNNNSHRKNNLSLDSSHRRQPPEKDAQASTVDTMPLTPMSPIRRKLAMLSAEDPEQKKDAETKSESSPQLDNKALGLPDSQSNSMKFLV